MPKSATPKPKPDDQEQSERFMQTAEDLGVEESNLAFERVFGLIAKPPPTPTTLAESKDSVIKERKR